MECFVIDWATGQESTELDYEMAVHGQWKIAEYTDLENRISWGTDWWWEYVYYA